MANSTEEIISQVKDESDRYLLGRIRSSVSTSSEGNQAQTLLQMRMIDRLIASLDKNSDSADKLANRLNWLTLVIAAATAIGAIVAVFQLFQKSGNPV